MCFNGGGVSEDMSALRMLSGLGLSCEEAEYGFRLLNAMRGSMNGRVGAPGVLPAASGRVITIAVDGVELLASIKNVSEHDRQIGQSPDRELMDKAWREIKKKDACLKGHAEGKENGLSLIPTSPHPEAAPAEQGDYALKNRIEAFRRPLDSMENDGDMFGKGFNYAIDKIVALFASRPQPEAPKDTRELADMEDAGECADVVYDILTGENEGMSNPTTRAEVAAAIEKFFQSRLSSAREQGEGPKDAGAWWWVQKIRARRPSHDNSWQWSNKDAARRLDDYFKQLLSSRPKPEVKVDEDYSTLLERHISELRNFAARCEARVVALEKE
jgi:hypothetical protein